MSSLHLLAAFVVLGASALLAVAGGIAAWRDIGHEWIRRYALSLVGLCGVVAAMGLWLLLTGESPRDGLHIIYGAVLVAAVPMGLTFASDAPPDARSGVLAVAGLVMILLVWRLFSTG